MTRDFRGYANQPPDVRWPADARVAVSVVLNFEEGAEFAISQGDARNEAVYEAIDPLGGPDPCIESHFEYGIRAAYWRVMELVASFGIKITVSACGRAVEVSPWLARDAFSRGHEIAAHGYRWESHAGLTEREERERISKTVRAIEAATGERPVGWHTRSAASPNTRRLLVEEGGFLYDSDAYNDDLPYFVHVSGRRHVVLPYAFDTNDMHFLHTQRFGTGDEFASYVIAAFDWLAREGETRPRMMSIGLHLRMIGRPGRMGGLERIFQHLDRSRGAWFARRDQIARYWIEHCPS